MVTRGAECAALSLPAANQVNPFAFDAWITAIEAGGGNLA